MNHLNFFSRLKFKNAASGRWLAALILMAGVSATAPATHAADRDDRIEDTFKNTYVYRTQLRETDLSISARDGLVTLKGTVESDDQRRLAEDTARGLPGVTRVENLLKVRNEPKESSDDWIALKVRGALLFHRNVSVGDTKVIVQNGVVTLTGRVETAAEKELAAQYAADVKGVQKVRNDIQVVPAPEIAGREGRPMEPRSAGDHPGEPRRTVGEKIDDASITAQLKYALSVRRSTSAFKTDVTTHEGVVMIGGEARSEAEKDLVTELAKNIDGVREVRNSMNVRP